MRDIIGVGRAHIFRDVGEAMLAIVSVKRGQARDFSISQWQNLRWAVRRLQDEGRRRASHPHSAVAVDVLNRSQVSS